MDKSIVVVSRKWHEPFIRVDVTTVGIGVTMTLEDFVTALEAETGQTLQAAAVRIVSTMKQETAKVM